MRSLSIFRNVRYSTFVPQLLHSPGKCILPRGIVQVEGPDAIKFLNGLCTRDISKWLNSTSRPAGIFGGFLTSHGRMMYEGFIVRHEDKFLIDCHQDSAIDLVLFLTQYRLRRQISIKDVSPHWKVIAQWNTNDNVQEEDKDVEGIKFTDNRSSGWRMSRIFTPVSHSSQANASEDTSIYRILRMINGIPEGPLEVRPMHSIPMEINLDLMGGVDLHKGCYLGQELVTRTLHRGVVRKRIVPVKFMSHQQPPNMFTPNPSQSIEGLEAECDLMQIEPTDAKVLADVTRIEPRNPVAKLVAIQGNMGLALARLDQIHSDRLFAIHRVHPSPDVSSFVLAAPQIPDWWPSNKEATAV